MKEVKTLEVEKEVLKKIDMMCRFANCKYKVKNGSIINIKGSNLTYLEPHRIIINDITFLVFNYSNEIFIENLNNKIKLSELENYLKHN